MFAIIVSEDTVDALVESDIFSESEKTWLLKFAASASVGKWIIISGFVSDRGRYTPWTLYPSFRFRKHFDHDWEKMQREWDIVVRRD